MGERQGHSRFGGSKADRWMNCPGSVALCDTVPERPSSSYAAEGTMAHAVAEYALKNGYDSAHKASADMPLEGGIVSIEMCDAVQVYLDAVYAEIAAAPDSELYVEQSFTFPGMGGEVYGTNDAVVYTPSRRRLVVFDYKHGQGVSVSADNNAQLRFYASGALLANPEWKVSEIELVIVQPRALDADVTGAVKIWPMPIIDVIEFSADVEKAVAEANEVADGFATFGRVISITDPLEEEPRLKTGPWCRWCDAAAICPAREAEATAAMGLAFSDVTMVDATALDEPSRLDGERIAQVLKGLQILTGWAAQVQEFAEAQMLAGTLEVPGWKVVEKIGRAKWIDADDEIAAYLEMTCGLDLDEVMPRKIATITQVEKLMKAAKASKDEIAAVKERFTIKESSGLTIAPAGDRRPAVTPNASHFDGVKVESE